MAWTDPPKTWSPGETVTAEMMNVHIRDQLNVLASAKAIIATFGAVGASLATGWLGAIYVPFAYRINSWQIAASSTCSVTIHIRTLSQANMELYSGQDGYGTEISGTDKPTLSAEKAAQDTSLSGWSVTDIPAGRWLTFAADSVSGAEQVMISLGITVR